MNTDKKEQYYKIKDTYIPSIPYSEKLSAKEKELDECLSRIKKEADALYTVNDPYGIIEWNDEEDVHTEFYNFCHDLPKGADLHAHDNTMIPYDRFRQIIIENAMISLSGGTRGTLYTRYNPDLPKDAVDVSEALRKGILSEKELADLLVIGDGFEAEGYWHRLEELFSATGDFYNDIPMMVRIWEEGFRSCYEKGIQLVEVRDWAGTDDMMNIIRDRTLREAYYRVRKDHPDFLVRLIGCSGKYSTNTIEESCNALRSMIRVRDMVRDEFDPENPEDFVIGLDLGNEEDNSRPLSDYADFLMSDEVKDSGLKLFLHCGESLRKDNDSVVDAFLMKTARAGHAMNLYRFPQLIMEYANNEIAIEVCPMSNYRLGYIRDLRLHPGLLYMISGIPIVICSDDGLFMTRSPLVDDFYSVILCWDLGLGDIKAVCRNSIKYSGLSEKQIDRLMKAWEEKWDLFVDQQLDKLKKE